METPEHDRTHTHTHTHTYIAIQAIYYSKIGDIFPEDPLNTLYIKRYINVQPNSSTLLMCIDKMTLTQAPVQTVGKMPGELPA